MSERPRIETLEIEPSQRLDVIDVRERLADSEEGPYRKFPRALYISYHTTAGYVDPRLSERLDHDPDAIKDFFQAFQRLFPPGAGYRHDQLELRSELTEEEKTTEPKNADSHLTYIGAGMSNCVSYEHASGRPIWFVDLDGTYGSTRRRRRTTIIGYNEEQEVDTVQIEIPVSSHQVESVNLRDPETGFLERLQEKIDEYGIEAGRIDVRLASTERHAGLTVNEYETLLMRHDLAEVLKNPFHYMAEKGKHVLQDPRSVPGKTLSYAQYDGIQILNKFLDLVGASESVVERILNRILAVPASRFMRIRRQISLPVFDPDGNGRGEIVEGTYQSPILLQWKKSETSVRVLDVTFSRFV